jgi:curved DNA-binding protein CbpA
MFDGLSLDPHTVLGVSREATSEEVRDAFHLKSKKHHPDLGGDEWAFRIVVRAYEILSEGPGATRGPSVSTVREREEADDKGRVRPGVVDKRVEPTNLVNVEMLWMRYEVEDFLELLTPRTEDRHLSGSLTITWPDPTLADRAATIPRADRILRALNAAFDEARARPEVRGARSRIEAGRFEAWLSYPNGGAAWQAFKALHVGLKARGLGVKQWTRDLTVPRD